MLRLRLYHRRWRRRWKRPANRCRDGTAGKPPRGVLLTQVLHLDLFLEGTLVHACTVAAGMLRFQKLTCRGNRQGCRWRVRILLLGRSVATVTCSASCRTVRSPPPAAARGRTMARPCWLDGGPPGRRRPHLQGRRRNIARSNRRPRLISNATTSGLVPLAEARFGRRKGLPGLCGTRQHRNSLGIASPNPRYRWLLIMQRAGA